VYFCLNNNNTDNKFIEINNLIKEIQNDLFDLGADLSTPISKTKEKYPPLRIKKTQVEKIEQQIDKYNSSLKPLNSFILPGGSEASSLLHMSRTIARRAERDTSLLGSEEPINAQSLIYLNRLSDLLFVLCRVLNENGLKDILWIPGLNQD
jgi:cob(I)alamin adenosyltransferase